MLRCPLDEKVISINAVNDNYCDCPLSGFDEPGKAH